VNNLITTQHLSWLTVNFVMLRLLLKSENLEIWNLFIELYYPLNLECDSSCYIAVF
jgi:hypothetical protein